MGPRPALSIMYQLGLIGPVARGACARRVVYCGLIEVIKIEALSSSLEPARRAFIFVESRPPMFASPFHSLTHEAESISSTPCVLR